MEKFKKWLNAQRVDAGGNFIKAMRYISKRWTALTRFLDDARIPLDTNFVERGFVPTAIG
ncbi:MAG: transposase, partial [Deltaproteobacteria bacterium]|nr:transposase [Deltaproteobacteria bacterium]